MEATVIVPTYKRNAYLVKALDSVQKQTFTDFECLIVNDYPPFHDEVEAIVAALGDERFRVIHHEKNGGQPQARNTAILQAQTNILALLDDDDIWEPDFLELHVQRHRDMPEAGMVYSGAIEFWEEDILGTKFFPATPPPEDIRTAILRGEFCLKCTSIVSVKRDAIMQSGMFDVTLPSYVDWDMWLRMSERYTFAHVEKPLAWFRHHLGKRESTTVERRMRGIKAITSKWSHNEEFVNGFQRSLKVSAYFNEIQKQVLQGNRKEAFNLLLTCIKECKEDLKPNMNLIGIASAIVMMGDKYAEMQKKKHPPQAI